jgi:beta-lactamase regulating signal transducer with metallopeptidase domain
MVFARGLLDFLLAALWQDACIALVVGALLAVAGRRVNARTRALMLQCAVLTMVAVPLATTVSHAVSRAPGEDRAVVTQLGAAPAAAPAHDAAAVAPQPIRIPSSDAVVLVADAAWLIGFIAFALRVAAGGLQLARLVRRSTRLADRDGVRVFASPDLAMPLAFGLFAPSVMVPAELVMLGGDDLECVLLHEIAHVRRRDAWANACERLVQAVLFFNPAVLLTLRAIAFEREAACDDWAVERSHDLDAYARGLASFALRRAEDQIAVACGVTGFGRATVARLRRLEDPQRNGAVTLARPVLGGFSIVLVALALSIHMFAPSIALATENPVVAVVGSDDPCPKIVPGPPQLPKSVPAGLRSEVEVRVSPQGTVATPTLETSSGNAAFDRLTSSGARQFLLAIGKTIPPHCNAPVPGTYRMSQQSGVLRAGGRTRSSRWTIQSDRMKKPIVLDNAPARSR